MLPVVGTLKHTSILVLQRESEAMSQIFFGVAVGVESTHPLFGPRAEFSSVGLLCWGKGTPPMRGKERAMLSDQTGGSP